MAQEDSQLLQALLDNLPDSIYFKDRQSHFTRINRAQASVLGVADPAEAIGKSDADFMTEELARWFLEEEQEMMASGQPVVNRVEFNPLPDGRERWFSATKVPLRDGSGRITGMVGLSRDITSLKRIEGELRSQRELFQGLVAVARAAADPRELEESLRQALQSAVSVACVQWGAIVLFDESGRPAEWFQWPPADGQSELAEEVEQLAQRVGRERRSQYGPGCLAAPILSGPVVMGALALGHSQPGFFGEQQERLLEAVADQMALALRNAQAFSALEQTAARERTLYEVLRHASEQLDPESAAALAQQAIGHFAGWPHSFIALAQPEGNRWYSPTGAVAAQPLKGGVVGRAIASGQTQYVPNVAEDPDYVAARPETRSELAVPLRRGGRILGALNIEQDEVDAFEAGDVAQAKALAGAVALAIDNARLHQAVAGSEVQLHALLEASRDGNMLVDLKGRALVANRAALDLLGLEGQPAEWHGRPLAKILARLGPEGAGLVKAAVAEMGHIRQGDETAAEGEAAVGGRSIHWLNLPVKVGERPLGRLVVLRDVTAERQVDEMREELVGALVHDLRNPLANMRMSVELLQDSPALAGAEMEQRVLTVLQRAVSRMSGLVNDILDVSRLESGQLPLELGEVNVAGVVAECLEQQRFLANEKGLSLVNSVAADLPPLPADADLLSRVAHNLVGNAIKFTPAGGRIEVGARVVAEDGAAGWMEVMVRDTGTGVPAELQPRLFQKFVTGRHASRGSGLGLVFCRLVVEAHGGRIWITTPPGGGASVHFTIPLGRPEGQPTAPNGEP
jgi:PAS domain S-box-containing protein